jgi:hypothetical protein
MTRSKVGDENDDMDMKEWIEQRFGKAIPGHRQDQAVKYTMPKTFNIKTIYAYSNT